jgi:uncharacterized membrane protein YbhN (UPF0104 family)
MRALGCAAILVVLVWRFGTGAFLDGLAHVEVWSLAAASGIAVVTTVCCAWRWTLVARGLGVAVPLRTAVAAYYRSQFLNVATPGGVLGDVDRAVRHGRDVGDTSRGLRSVVWERFAGQLVLIAVAGCTVSVLPSPVRPPGRVVGAAVVVGMVTIGLLALSIRSGPLPVWARTLGRARVDLRAGVLARHTWPGVLVTSAIAVAGYVLTFLIAARTAGSSASPLQLLPLAVLVIVAMGLPSIAGWGPREGMAAWAFGAAGLGAEQGVATAVVYGVMVLVASLPGAVLLVMSRLRRAPFGAGPGHDRWPVAAASAAEGAADV